MFKRVVRAFKRRNLREIFQLVAHNLKYSTKKLSVAEFRARREEHKFDRKFGIKTSSVREMGDLDVPIELARHGVRYEPSAKEYVIQMIGLLDIEFSRYVFVDYGSGKGRVLFLASNYPFQRIIGVEFSRELHQVTKKNIISYTSPAQRCFQIASVCCNAAEFMPPNDPLVCYFYNPFSEFVLQQVVSNLESSLKTKPRPAYILYLEPRCAYIFERSKYWETVVSDDDKAIYRANI